jgi:hypothetical protein
VQILFLRIQILRWNSNYFHQISIILDLRLRIKFQNFILNIFQTLSSKLFNLNLWTNVQIYIFEKVRKLSFKFKFPFESINFSCQKFKIGPEFPQQPVTLFFILHSTGPLPLGPAGPFRGHQQPSTKMKAHATAASRSAL